MDYELDEFRLSIGGALHTITGKCTIVWDNGGVYFEDVTAKFDSDDDEMPEFYVHEKSDDPVGRAIFEAVAKVYNHCYETREWYLEKVRG